MMTPERLAEIRAGVEDFACCHPDVMARFAYDLLAAYDESQAEVEWLAAEADELLRRAKSLADEKIAAEAEVNQLRAQAAEVRAIHVENRSERSPWCDQDGFAWPCATIRALSSVDEVPS